MLSSQQHPHASCRVYSVTRPFFHFKILDCKVIQRLSKLPSSSQHVRTFTYLYKSLYSVLLLETIIFTLQDLLMNFYFFNLHYTFSYTRLQKKQFFKSMYSVVINILSGNFYIINATDGGFRVMLNNYQLRAGLGRA